MAQHDYVVVPDLGGFVIQKMNAMILPERIVPPLATVGFNPLMSQSDGLLAIEIAKSEEISYRMAVELIENEVAKIKNQLDSIGTVQLSTIGQLSLNQSGNLIFLPREKADFLPTNFGLDDVYVKEFDNCLKDEGKKITFTFTSSRFYKYAAACLLIISLMFLTPKLTDKRQLNSADLLSTISLKTIDNNFKQSQVAIIDTLKSSILSGTTDSTTLKNYHVIVASLPTRKSAEAYCKVLSAENFSEVQILAPIRTYRVAIKSFSSLEDAIQYMENLRRSEKQFETAWVLCDN